MEFFIIYDSVVAVTKSDDAPQMGRCSGKDSVCAEQKLNTACLVFTHGLYTTRKQTVGKAPLGPAVKYSPPESGLIHYQCL